MGSSVKQKYLSILRVTGEWMILWLLIAGGTIYLLAPNGYNQLDKNHVVIIYFFAFTLFGIFRYKINGPMEHHERLLKQVLLSIGFYIFVLLLSAATNIYSPLDEIKTRQILDTKLTFPLFYVQTWLSKFFDILFQQVFILAIIKELYNLHLSKKEIMWIFTLAFTALHLPLVLSLKLYGLLFIFPSAAAGFIFAYLILNKKAGLFYSFAVHLSFYYILGLILRAV